MLKQVGSYLGQFAREELTADPAEIDRVDCFLTHLELQDVKLFLVANGVVAPRADPLMAYQDFFEALGCSTVLAAKFKVVPQEAPSMLDALICLEELGQVGEIFRLRQPAKDG